MQEHQQVIFMSGGGEDLRQVQEYCPHSCHIIDWFHISMRQNLHMGAEMRSAGDI